MLVLVLLLFLVMVVMIIIVVAIIIIMHGRLERTALGGFTFGGLARHSLAFRGLAFAHLPVVFPGIENQMQPGHHLLDRRQLTRRSGFAAWTGSTLCTGLALRSRLAAEALRSDFTLCAGLAVRSRLAARAFKTRRSGMPLRPGPSGLAARALRPLLSLPGRSVGHARTPPVNAGCFLSDVG